MYWNGRESYREGIAELNKSAKDNYNLILPVFNFGTKENAQSLNPYMDKAIEKASINIQRHSMYFEHKEQVRWIDDSYLLIGQAYFYKQEYHKAKRTFEFVMNKFKDEDIKYEAMIWLASSYNQMEKYKKAQSTLDYLKNEMDKSPKEIPTFVTKQFPLVKANMYLLQEKYDQAVDYLVDAVYLRQKKAIDARIKFILGQIYQSEDELYRASEYYMMAIKRNPAYELAFNAAINLATCYDTRYEEGSKDIRKKLNKMLKEDKNLDFRDQIYYALSDVAYKDNEDSLAIDYLRLSVATSVSNDFQKATSAIQLGSYFFKGKKYELAQAYYDTAIQVLPEEFPDYEKIKASSEFLNELVENLIVVQTEDSLQMLASMDEKERNIIIDKIIEDLKKQEEKEKEEAEAREQMAANAINNPGTSKPAMGGPAGRGKWYFYNPQTLNFGFGEFKKKWGNRKLEDNWFLSNKKAVIDFETEEFIAENDSLGGGTDSTAIASNDAHERAYYLKDLPLTEDQMKASNLKIIDAMYNLGFIYKEKFSDLPKSNESFEGLINRYPENDHLLQTYYQLYRSFSKMDSVYKAEYYKSLLVQQFPDSDYAKLLLDPNYYKELEAEKNRAITLYNETYDHYTSGHYYTVYSNSNRALSTFEEPEEILAKFEYLRALSIGKIEVVDSLQVALEELVKKYPESEVKPLAQNILDYLNGPIDTTSAKEEPEVTFDLSMYEFNPSSKQIFALVVDDAKVNINALKVRISDFNSKFYSIANISITNILLNTSTHFVMVGNFNTVNEALDYYHAIMSNEYVFANLSEDDYNGFVIAQENYPVFYKDKDVDKYLAFFKQNYLPNQ
jgi:tetratricopeptide (TPR) repeat protein